ncbi:MAG: ATP-binding protein, partial [Halomonas sp.]
ADIFRPLRAEFEVMADERGLDLDVVPTQQWVDSDPQMLRRIVQNFLSNAIRYTQEGRVMLGCRRQGERLVIEVWDSGPGIPDSKLSEIFQEFRRLDQVSRHKESEKGLGLGLSIADRMDNEVTGLMALEALSERLVGAVPGIVITADRTEAVAEEIKRAGYQLLLKPVRPAALRALLTRTLQASRAKP